MNRGGKPSRFLVIRIVPIFRYHEYFGPMYSTRSESHADAKRLYGKPNHEIKVVAWSKATKFQKQQARNQP